MKSIEPAMGYLEHLRRNDLSGLLAYSTYVLEDRKGFGRDPDHQALVIHSPKPYSEALKAIPEHDRKRIAEAILSGEQSITWGQAPIEDYSSESLMERPREGTEALLAELVINQQVMISVATGGERIQEVNDYFVARETRIREATRSAGIEYANPHEELWEWFRFYKEQFGTYQERRQYAAQLYKKPIAAVSARKVPMIPTREPTGWERVDRGTQRARSLLAAAANEEDFQTVGLVCREVLISLGQAVYDPEVHSSLDGIVPSTTDAARMLEAYIQHEVGGASNKEIRAHAKASLGLALNLQHKRTATSQMAALCLEATSSTVAVIAILAGLAAI